MFRPSMFPPPLPSPDLLEPAGPPSPPVVAAPPPLSSSSCPPWSDARRCLHHGRLLPIARVLPRSRHPDPHVANFITWMIQRRARRRHGFSNVDTPVNVDVQSASAESAGTEPRSSAGQGRARGRGYALILAAKQQREREHANVGDGDVQASHGAAAAPPPHEWTDDDLDDWS